MAETARVPSPVRGRGAAVAAVAGALFAALVAATVVFRTDVVHGVLADRLAALGLSGATFEVASVGFGSARIHRFRAGDTLAFEDLTVRYAPADLIDARVRQVELAGLRLDLGGQTGSAAQRMVAAIGGEGAAAGGPSTLPAIPSVTIRDAHIVAGSGAAKVTALIDGALGPTRDGNVPVSLRLAFETPYGLVTGPLDAVVTPGKDGIAAEVRTKLESLVLAMEGRHIERAAAAITGHIKAGGAEGSIATYDLAVVVSPFSVASRSTADRIGTVGVALEGVATTGRIGAAGAYDGTVTIGRARVTAHDRAVAAEGLAAILAFGREAVRPVVRLTARAIAEDAPAPIAKPLALEATVWRREGGLSVEAALTNRAAGMTVAITGSHEIAAGQGRADFTVEQLAFRTGGPQPADVVPALAGFDGVEGTLGLRGRLAWDAGALAGQGRIALDGFGFGLGAARFAGIAGTVQLDGLFPPMTARAQRLTIASIEAGGARFNRSSVEFQLGKSGELTVRAADSTFAGGRISVRDARIDPRAPENRLTVRVSNVDLGELVGLLDLKDVAAAGRISGAIPLAIEGGAMVVRAAKLAATGPGTLRLRSEEAARLLEGGGEQVALMLRALEDFRYDRLAVEVDKDAGGEARVVLRLGGHNPAVLDSHPFDINVNLVTNLDRILDALAEWYRLSGKALDDIVGGSRKGAPPK